MTHAEWVDVWAWVVLFCFVCWALVQIIPALPIRKRK